MKVFMIMNHLHSAKYRCKPYKNLPEDEENRIAEYRKSILKYGKIKLLQKLRLVDVFD